MRQMTVSTCDIPEQSLWLRRNYLYDNPGEHEPGYVRAYWFAIHSWRGRALDCIVHTDEGMVRDQLPLTALCAKPHAEHIPLEYLQLWNCFGYNVTAIEYEYLSRLPCSVLLKDGSGHLGEYLFTVDWYGDNPSEMPGDEGRKSGHIVALDCGCIAMTPNNRMLVHESSFATKASSFEEMRKRGYKVNTRDWRVERHAKWVTEDSDQFYYRFVRGETGK